MNDEREVLAATRRASLPERHPNRMTAKPRPDYAAAAIFRWIHTADLLSRIKREAREMFKDRAAG